MAGAIFPDMGDSQPFNQRDAHILIDDLVQKGNRVAEARKAELVFLETAFQEFTRRVQQQGLQTMSWSDAVEDSRMDINDGTEPTTHPHQMADGSAMSQPMSGTEGAMPASLTDSDGVPQMGLSTVPQTPADAAFLDNIGISADDFLNIVDQMASEDFDAFGLFGHSGMQ
jgi:proline utilization trans-activator